MSPHANEEANIRPNDMSLGVNEDSNIPSPAVIPRKIQAVANATIADDNVWYVNTLRAKRVY